MKSMLVLKEKVLALHKSTAGAAAALTALMITVLIGFLGLSFDLGHLTLVKSELQRAADAGALAGARALAPYPNDAGLVGNILWDNVIPDDGTKPTKKTVFNNKVDGVALTECLVEAGYWDLNYKTLLPYTTSWLNKDMIPAVRVTINKAGEVNGGPVNFFFGSFVGKTSSDLSVQSLAALPGGPSLAIKGSAFPFAVPKIWVENNWNNPSLTIVIGSIQNPENKWVTSDQGQWTSFLLDKEDVDTIRTLMDDGNPTQIKIGDEIFIQPGAKAALYGDAGAFVDKVVLIPVVEGDVTAKTHTPIIGFVAFKIKETNQGDKWIKGHFEKNYIAPGTRTEQSAPFYGTWASSPKLVQ